MRGFIAFLCFLLVDVSVAFLGASRAAPFPSRMQKLSMKWDGTRPPIPSMEWLSQRMDATWGRGKFRAEVWDDNVNPMNDWWLVFTPSQEEIEASEAGYDFSNPKEWFEKKGIDSTKAMEKGLEATKAALDKYLEVSLQRRCLRVFILRRRCVHMLIFFYIFILSARSFVGEEKGEASIERRVPHA